MYTLQVPDDFSNNYEERLRDGDLIVQSRSVESASPHYVVAPGPTLQSDIPVVGVLAISRLYVSSILEDAIGFAGRSLKFSSPFW